MSYQILKEDTLKIYVEEKNNGASNALKVLKSDITLREIPGGIDGMTKVTIISTSVIPEIESLRLKIHNSLPPILFKYIVLPFNLQQAIIYLESKFTVEFL